VTSTTRGRIALLAAVVTVLWTMWAVRTGSPQGAGDVVYINSSGGILDDVNRKVHWDTFTKATGIKVVSTAPVDNAKLKVMVDSGNVQWDVTEVDDGDFWRAIKLGLLEKVDLSQLPTQDLPKEAYNEYGVWDGPYSTVVVWRTDVWPMSGKHPSGLMDLWNQTDFPGPRCLWKDAMDNLELGARHAGIPREKLYPINQDAAYQELSKLKKQVAVWWTTGAQSVQVLINKDCVMGTAWNGRPYQLVVKSNAPLGVAWGDAVLRTSWWAIPRGAKHYKAAMMLIAWMQDPQRQAQQAEETGYSGANKKTASFLSARVKDYLATTPEHLATTIVADDNWWAENGPAAEKQFTGWLLSD
jgi:putative spermidine/putrescine transport system substrate-binding protein